MTKKTLYISIGIGILLLIAGAAMFFLFRPNSGTTSSPDSFFGFGNNVSTTGTNGGGSDTNVPQTGSQSLQKVFKLADGPVAGAAFMQTFNPTTTLVRYVMQDNGHVFDLTVDSPGAAARAASNTTIPSVTSALWGRNASSTVLQYVDSGTLKSVYIAFATSSGNTTTAPAHVQFLPNNLLSLALSPDNKNMAYLLKNSLGGADGYVTNADGTSPRKLFSLPLSQTLLSWPSGNVLVAQTKSAENVPGIAFVINAKTNGISPLLYAQGLTTRANDIFSKVVYQTSSGSGTKTYAHDVSSGMDTPMAGNPLPEKCAWSPSSSTQLYCATPLSGAPANYLDMWHQGLVTTPDSILKFDTNTGVGVVITIPGDGGVSAPIDQLSVSQDGKYLLFITRGDHSLWGVRLTQ